MDVFDYQSHFFNRLAQAHDVAAPIQGELHPGLHCDLYKCPHCYGFGQPVLAGEAVTAADIDRALGEVEPARPTIIISGITTEPLTHPDAAGIIRAVARRRLPLGLYTKGRRLDAEVRAALLSGDGETFVTVSLDSTSADDYMRRHDIPPAGVDGLDRTRGADYFGIVHDNLMRLHAERGAAGSPLSIRGAFLLFGDSANARTIETALRIFGPYVDLLRFAIPQFRNDGSPPGVLDKDCASTLHDLAEAFKGEPKVRILTNTANPERDRSFKTCQSQRFQFVIDKSGNLLPCPQVAVQAYRHLVYGNIRHDSLSALLKGPLRRALFSRDVDREMRCRICDRKDEAVNVALAAMSDAYN